MCIDLGFRRILCIVAMAIFGLFAINPSAKAQEWLISGWTPVPDSCCVKELSFAADGQLLGIGMNDHVYRWGSGPWSLIPDSCCMSSVLIAQDGRIVGNGTDGYLYTKKSWSAPWVLARNSCCTTTIAQMPDGTFLGRGLDSGLYTKLELEANWVPHKVSESGGIINAKSMANGSIIGVGRDYNLHYIGADKKWGLIPESAAIGGLTFANDGTIWATGTSNNMWWSRIRPVGASVNVAGDIVIDGKWKRVQECQGSQCASTEHSLTVGVEKGKEVSKTSTFGKAVSIMVGGSATTNSGSMPGGGASVSWSVTGTFSREDANTVATSFTTTENSTSKVTCTGEHVLWQWVTTIRDSSQSVTAGSKINRCTGIGVKPLSITDISWNGH